MTRDPLTMSAVAMAAAFLMVEAGKAHRQLVARVSRKRRASCGRQRPTFAPCACTEPR
jgi:hypothetical protein